MGEAVQRSVAEMRTKPELQNVGSLDWKEVTMSLLFFWVAMLCKLFNSEAGDTVASKMLESTYESTQHHDPEHPTPSQPWEPHNGTYFQQAILVRADNSENENYWKDINWYHTTSFDTAVLRSFVVFLSSSRKMLRYCRKLGHDCFLEQPFQIMIHNYPIIQRHIVWTCHSIIKQATNTIHQRERRLSKICSHRTSLISFIMIPQTTI